MAFQIGSNFSLQQAVPLDVRTVVSNQTERNALVTYPGLIVYVTNENKYYFYNGTSWTELVTGGQGATGATGPSGDKYLTTSTTNNSITLGSKTFTVSQDLAYSAGQDVIIANSSTNYMTGRVTSYTSNQLTVNITAINGSGSFASWQINLNGAAAGIGMSSFLYVNSATVVTKNTKIAVDTSASSFAITLPTSNLNNGDLIEIIDLNKTFDIRNLIINGTIEGSLAGLTCDVKGAHFNLIYVGGSTVWELSIIDNNFSKAGVIEQEDKVIPLLYLEIEGNSSSELFDSPDSQNYKIPWNRIQWINNSFAATGINIDNSKIITYNPINKNIYLRDSGIYNIDLRYGSFNLVDANDFLRARLRSSNTPITGGLADPSAPSPKLPLSAIDSNIPILASFAQGPIGTSFNGEAMQAGFTTFQITGSTYIVADFLHFGAFNINSNQARGYPINNNDFGNQPFMFLTKIQ
jgi:hypothetical protein